ncbi:MAG: allantoicase [Pseudonocardiaceae bacterium]|nr:allantoicase [Pseudonocardiaceae bacterium]
MTFMDLPDLASRTLGGATVVCNDESFCAAANLIKPGRPAFTPQHFDERGQIYDGWETRRRREPGSDWVIVRLGAPGVPHGVVIDTAYFTGNFPEHASIEAAWVDGPLETAVWREILPRSPLKGDTANAFAIADPHRFTHVRLTIHPDGGVARLRVHGEAVLDPTFASVLPLDLAALGNGGCAIDCSDEFYSAPNNLLLPGQARVTGEGWETRRRRDSGNDWVRLRLATLGVPRVAELDTMPFKFNASGAAMLTGVTAEGDEVELLPRTELRPDEVHRFLLPGTLPAVDHVRMDVYPDGGMGRLRLYGTPSASGLDRLAERWLATSSRA